MEEKTSNTNTLLLVVILVIIVGLGVWWYQKSSDATPAETDTTGITVDVNMQEPAPEAPAN